MAFVRWYLHLYCNCVWIFDASLKAARLFTFTTQTLQYFRLMSLVHWWTRLLITYRIFTSFHCCFSQPNALENKIIFVIPYLQLLKKPRAIYSILFTTCVFVFLGSFVGKRKISLIYFYCGFFKRRFRLFYIFCLYNPRGVFALLFVDWGFPERSVWLRSSFLTDS